MTPRRPEIRLWCHDRVLGVPAQAEQQGRDAVTDGHAGDAGPDRVDGAGCLEAEHS